MWKRKKPKKIVSSRMSKCSFCDKEFDWMTTPAIVNGAKKEFCGYECFSKNFENAVRHDLRIQTSTAFDIDKIISATSEVTGVY